MIDDYLDELGTLDEAPDTEDTPETSRIDSRDSLPELPIEDIDPKKIVFCKACKKRTVYIKTIDGECLTCAFKRLRRLESELSALHQLSGKREFCIMDGHREISKNKLFPDWNGKFVINGVELYPVQPLCSQCLAKLTTYFIFFLEERGILRRAPGHKDNLFGDPYNTKLTIIEENNAKIRLQKFIQSLDLFVLDRQSPMYSLYKDFRLRQRMLLKREAAKRRKCQEENETQENQENQKSLDQQKNQEEQENLE
jgi:hypothetical protein